MTNNIKPLPIDAQRLNPLPPAADFTPRDTQAMMTLNEALRRKIKRLTGDLTRALARVDELEAARVDAAETIKHLSTQNERLQGKLKRKTVT